MNSGAAVGSVQGSDSVEFLTADIDVVGRDSPTRGSKDSATGGGQDYQSITIGILLDIPRNILVAGVMLASTCSSTPLESLQSTRPRLFEVLQAVFFWRLLGIYEWQE